MERRKLPRLACSFPVHAMHLDEDGFFRAQVRDISLGGLSVDVPLKQDAQLKLKPGARMPGLRARVVWSDEDAAGLSFDDHPARLGRSWVLDELHRLGSAGRRRRQVEVPSSLSARSGSATGVLHNLSLMGALFECNQDFRVGHRLRLQIEHPELESLVVWAAVRRLEAGRRHLLEFVEMSRDQTLLLGQYLVHLLKSSRT